MSRAPSRNRPVQPAQTAPRLRYDKGGKDNRRKHQWKEKRAGFVIVRGVLVSKCPNGLPKTLPERLLNQGIGVDGDELAMGPRPLRIYVVYDGVVYRAKPTNLTAGTWHAFPEFPEELQKLQDAIWAKIQQRASDLGCLREVEKWKKG